MADLNIDHYKVQPDQPVDLTSFQTNIDSESIGEAEVKEKLAENAEKLQEMQQRLLAEEKQGVIFVLQALDAAGKDEAVRYLFSRLSAQALHTTAFDKPTEEDVKHDYLWRLHGAMPERGMIGVFNRSHYEELVAARVYETHKKEQLPPSIEEDPDIWLKRYTDVRHFEEYLANNGFHMVKIYLHVSKDIQKERLLDRIENRDKNWEFSMSDLEDRELWDKHMEAFEAAFQHTSTESSPWFVVPADHGDYGRLVISEILLRQLEELDPKYPELSEEEKEEFEQAAKDLRAGKYD